MQVLKKGNNQFYIGEDPNMPLAEITFVHSGANKIIIDHTYVSNAMKGRGIGERLVKQVVEYARQENKKIVPLCSFAKKIITCDADCQDVLFE